jgi:hypothetical protein
MVPGTPPFFAVVLIGVMATVNDEFTVSVVIITALQNFKNGYISEPTSLPLGLHRAGEQ